jgi:DNA-binding MurR/RpiR family transcriptional regulator
LMFRTTPPIVVRLQSQFAELSPALARVAKHIINYPSETTTLSIEALSQITESGEASIVRLAHILGFVSFRSFKLALAAQCGAPAQDLQGGEVADEVERLRRDMSDNLEGAARLLDRNILRNAATALVLRRHANIYGGGVSAMVGDILAAKLLRAGIWATSYRDSNVALEVMAPASRDAVAIAISDSGSTLETVRLLRAARAAGALTVAITSRPSSPIAGHADLVLLTAPMAQPPSAGFVTSVVAQFFVLQALVDSVAATLAGANQSTAKRPTSGLAVKRSPRR